MLRYNILSCSVACGKAIVNALPADVADINLTNWTKPAYDPGNKLQHYMNKSITIVKET